MNHSKSYNSHSSHGEIITYDIIVLERHLDTFGHVNNATYFEIFEEARWQLITSRGYSLEEIQKRKQGPVILEANIKFLQELTLREHITITTQLLNYKGKIGTLEQKMLKQDGSEAAVVQFVFGLFDLEKRKLIDPTLEWKKAIGWR